MPIPGKYRSTTLKIGATAWPDRATTIEPAVYPSDFLENELFCRSTVPNFWPTIESDRCGLWGVPMVLGSNEKIDRLLFPDRRRFSYTVYVPERRRKQDQAPPARKICELDGKKTGGQIIGGCRLERFVQKRHLKDISSIQFKVTLKRQRRRSGRTMQRKITSNPRLRTHSTHKT